MTRGQDEFGGMSQVDRRAGRRSWRLLEARISTIGLWILPDLWKTPQTGVSHRSLDGPEIAPSTGSTGLHP